MIGVYFSGTGNTKHCIQKITKQLDSTAECMSIENDLVKEFINKDKFIIFGYPVQYSNTPAIVRTFIKGNADLWKGKQILCVATMGAFSGDGAGCTARLFKKYGAKVVGGLHIKMPNSRCDNKSVAKSAEENKALILVADQKMEQVTHMIQDGKYPKEGLNIFYHMAGLFGQRLWFYGITKNYSDKIKISDVCVGCGLCEEVCPMKNVEIKNGKAVAKNQCTMCYRCINLCPKKAMTLIGKEVVEQVRYEKY